MGSEQEVTVGVQLRITAHHLPGSGAAEAGRHVPLELFLLPCTTKPKRVDFQSIHTNLTTQNTSSSNQRLPISDWNTREKLLSISMKLPRLFKKDEIANKNQECQSGYSFPPTSGKMTLSQRSKLIEILNELIRKQLKS